MNKINLVKILSDIFMISSVLSVIYLSYKYIKEKVCIKLEKFLLLIGVLLSHLIVEVSARYMILIIVPLSFILVINIRNLVQKN